MNLRLVSETATTITLGWDPVAGAVGYRFTAEKQAKPSHTWDPSRSTVKFAKGSSWYKVEALEAPQSGSYPPPVVATPLPTYRISVKPNHYSDNDGPAENYRAVWVDHSSANTSDQFPNTASVIASPMSTDPRATKKSWVWYFAHEVMIDPSWDPSKQGAWGTTAPEGHNCAHDVGSTGHGGIGWGFGAGSASFQMDFVGGNLYQHIENADYNIFPKGRNVVAAPLSKGVWHSVLTELTLGRTDGSVPSAGHPYNGKGRVRTWMDGSDVPVDTGPTDTFQRDVNPDNGQDASATQRPGRCGR